MTAERGPEDQKSIVVRSEQSSLEQATRNPLLEKVGFSPQFGDRLMSLNDVIVKRGAAPRLNTVGVAVVPGKVPVITTEVLHGEGVRIFTGSDGRVADLELNTNEPFGSSLIVKIEDIQDFVKTLFPNKEARVFAGVTEALEKEEKDLDIDLYQLNNEILKTFHELRKVKKVGGYDSVALPYTRFEVRVAGQGLPKRTNCLFAFHLMTNVSYPDRVGCRIKEFNYQGLPKKVEEVIDKLVVLFDKNPMYPFREEQESPKG